MGAEPKERITIRLSRLYADWLKEIAKDTNVPMSVIVEALIRQECCNQILFKNWKFRLNEKQEKSTNIELEGVDR
jgi:hypothetical protein